MLLRFAHEDMEDMCPKDQDMVLQNGSIEKLTRTDDRTQEKVMRMDDRTQKETTITFGNF
jgi:Zn-finger nucleic acid-binding protein